MQTHAQEVKAHHTRHRLSELDSTLSLRLYRSVGVRIPRPVFMALEHSGSGLLWLPLAPLVWLAPGLPPQACPPLASLCRRQ